MSKLPTYQFPFAKYPAVRIAILFSAGIILASYTSLGMQWLLAILACWSGLFVAAEYGYSKTYNNAFFYVSTGAYLFGVILTGTVWHTAFDQQKEPSSARLLSAHTWEEVQFKGTIQNIKQTSSGKYQLDIAVDTTMVQDSLSWLEAYKLRAIYDPGKESLPEDIRLANRIYFSATVYPLEGKTNPHEFDYKRYLATQNIYSQVGIDSVIAKNPAITWLSWHRFRRQALTLINKNFSENTIPLAKALLLGYKNELSQDDKIAFSRVGLSHIMAVSGLHVGFLLAPFWFLIPFLWTKRWGKQLGLIFLIILLLVYAGLTGFSASVTRASITGGLITYGRLFHKARDSKNLTAVAALIILLINPNELFEVGFQLSFAAVYTILLVIPVCQSMIPARIRHRWYGIPIMVAIVSVVVQLGLYPLLSYYFGEFSISGPIANALVVPVLTVLVPYSLFLLLVSAVLPGVGYIFNAPCRWFLDLLQQFVTYLSASEWSWIQTSTTGVFVFLIWVTALFLITSLPIPKLRWKMLGLFLAVFCLQQGTALYQTIQPATLKVTMLDVGQGDAAYVKTPSGKNILIDAGRWTPDYNSARYVIIPHLKAAGVQKLDAVFLSHPHADHIGGILELIDEIPIGTIYNSGYSYESELYNTYLQQAARKQIPVKSLTAGDMISIDPAMRMLVYGPSKDNHHSDPNEHSLIVELIYGETEFLFMGDGGTAQESLLLDNYGPMLDTDFLKVGHHGSRTASSAAFLEVAMPAFSGVSLGKTNPFNHPHSEAINNLQQTGTRLFYTGLEGALQFSSDGYSIQQKMWR